MVSTWQCIYVENIACFPRLPDSYSLVSAHRFVMGLQLEFFVNIKLHFT